jgi:hypothetical protein
MHHAEPRWAGAACRRWLWGMWKHTHTKPLQSFRGPHPCPWSRISHLLCPAKRSIPRCTPVTASTVSISGIGSSPGADTHTGRGQGLPSRTGHGVGSPRAAVPLSNAVRLTISGRGTSRSSVCRPRTIWRRGPSPRRSGATQPHAGRPAYLGRRVRRRECLGEGGRAEALEERRVDVGRADDRCLDVCASRMSLRERVNEDDARKKGAPYTHGRPGRARPAAPHGSPPRQTAPSHRISAHYTQVHRHRCLYACAPLCVYIGGVRLVGTRTCVYGLHAPCWSNSQRGRRRRSGPRRTPPSQYGPRAAPASPAGTLIHRRKTNA